MNAGGVASPCINICRLDPTGRLCEGCLRTIDEIGMWSTASDAERRAILKAVAERRALLTPQANLRR
ncbi:MAG: DUF1289 domain-containing protein [Sphingomonas sanxanigenens]|uniref:DUF1289 domain-containing protein n=1 Tax=Sphingomonas sanxanigenens TaxID=397260 RepID=A0A2W5ADA8_9SPHN|nr:MAG: DUF1289 domain-containing protein [Sphingomonas sanxanigenens]